MVRLPEKSVTKTWFRVHFFRSWTAIVTLFGFGWAFLYRPEWLTLWLRTTMTLIEKIAAILPYPWGDRFEVALRGIGALFWLQITLAIVLLRLFVWTIGYSLREPPAVPVRRADRYNSISNNE